LLPAPEARGKCRPNNALLVLFRHLFGWVFQTICLTQYCGAGKAKPASTAKRPIEEVESDSASDSDDAMDQ
jgi:hypothetical protein